MVTGTAPEYINAPCSWPFKLKTFHLLRQYRGVGVGTAAPATAGPMLTLLIFALKPTRMCTRGISFMNSILWLVLRRRAELRGCACACTENYELLLPCTFRGTNALPLPAPLYIIPPEHICLFLRQYPSQATLPQTH